MTIYKFPLAMTDRQTVALPRGSKVLDVQFQRAQLCVWAAVDLDTKEHETRTIRIAGTGHDLNRSGCPRILRLCSRVSSFGTFSSCEDLTLSRRYIVFWTNPDTGKKHYAGRSTALYTDLSDPEHKYSCRFGSDPRYWPTERRKASPVDLAGAKFFSGPLSNGGFEKA